jgi:hypothetical protein
MVSGVDFPLQADRASLVATIHSLLVTFASMLWKEARARKKS